MFKHLAFAGTIAAGLALSPLGTMSAGAVPMAKDLGAIATTDNLVLARREGGRSFGGGGRGMRAFGGGRSMGGHRFSRGSMGGMHRSIRPRDFGGSGMRFRHGKHWGGKHHHHGHRHHRHRRFYSSGYYPYYGAAYYGGYYGDCNWLRRKAIRSGSSYWWRRYEACVEGY